MSHTKTILRPAYSMLERAILDFLDFEATDVDIVYKEIKFTLFSCAFLKLCLLTKFVDRIFGNLHVLYKLQI